MLDMKWMKTTLRGYRTLHDLIPGYLLSTGLRAVFSALFPFINIYMSARILTALANHASIRQVLLQVVITITLNLVISLVLSCMQRLSDYYVSPLWQVQNKPTNEKIQQMDYEHVENTDVHMLLEKFWAMQQSNGLGLYRLTWSYIGIIEGVATILFSVSLVAGAFLAVPQIPTGGWRFLFEPWFAAAMALLVVVNTALDIYMSTARTKKQASLFFRGFAKVNRIGNYLYNHLGTYRSGKDFKLYALHDLLLDLMRGITDRGIQIARESSTIGTKYDGIGVISSTMINGMIYAYVAVKALFGSFGVGSVVQYVGSLTRFSHGIAQVMENITILRLNVEALDLFYAFLDMPDKKYKGALSVEKRIDNEYEIEFHDVFFKYPGTDTYVLKHLNLKFNIGQRMAVVGMNGSGKTTMIKLLCRLYDPTEGEIKLNGIDIRKYDYTEYMAIFSVVFQDFKLFSFSLGQNVAASVDYESKSVLEALNKAGLSERLSTLPRGLDTPLYKDFEEDGVEISGGEAQKIALARALYKGAPFIVLDEPTAALDPIAEFEIYSKFNEIVGDRTAIYISHKLSSCRFCDDIAVFHEGELVQRGSHETLLGQELGKYRELWFAQAQYYTEEAG